MSTPDAKLIARLKQAKRELQVLQEEHGSAVLAASRKPDDKALAAAVEDHEAALQQYEKSIQRITAAIEASEREVKTEDLVAKAKLHAERRAQAKALGAEIAQLAAHVADTLESLAPSLARLDAALGERQRVLHAAAVSAFGAKQASNRVNGEMSGRGAVEVGLVGAVISSGLGVTPSLSPSVVVAEPWGGLKTGAYSRDRMAANLARAAKQIDELFAQGAKQ